MLDAFIIEKIRREQEQESGRPPLRIQIPPPRPRDREQRPDWRDEGDSERGGERGVVIIDF